MFLIGHGISVRSDLPIPEWLFGWAAAMVLVVSFVALAVLWPEPRLQKPTWRPLPGGIGRVLASRPVEIICGAIGIFLLGLTIYAGLRGTESTDRELRADLHLRDLLARAGAAERAVRRRLPGVQPVARDRPGGGVGRADRFARASCRRRSSTRRLGRWPAAVGIFAFATLELVASNGDKPDTPRGRGARLLRGHLHRDGALRRRALDRARRGLRRLLQPVLAHLAVRDARRRGRVCAGRSSGLPRLEPLPGTVALLAVMIGIGLVRRLHRQAPWNSISPDIARVLPGPRPLARSTRSRRPSCSG